MGSRRDSLKSSRGSIKDASKRRILLQLLLYGSIGDTRLVHAIRFSQKPFKRSLSAQIRGDVYYDGVYSPENRKPNKNGSIRNVDLPYNRFNV